MGAWVSLIGNFTDANSKIKKFESVFSVQGVPKLNSYFIKHKNSNANTFVWGWGKGIDSDLQIIDDEDFVFILHGCITDLGCYGSIRKTQKETAFEILKLWRKDKQLLINELNGSFSCLFYHKKEKLLNIFSDRYASRPIWYSEDNGNVIVSNFPSAIAIFKTNPLKINLAGLWSLLYMGRHVGNQGLYDNIKCLMAGEKLLKKNEILQVKQWWCRKFTPNEGISSFKWGKKIANALKKSADLYKKTCTNPHLFLSGGLDSRVAISAFGKPMKGISLCTVPNAETKIASIITKILNIEHTCIIRSPYWYLNTLDAAALISSGNYFTDHTHFIIPAVEITQNEKNAQFFLGDLMENFNKHYFSPTGMDTPNFKLNNMEDFLIKNVSFSIKQVQRVGSFLQQDIQDSIHRMYSNALKKYASSVLDVSLDNADRFDTMLRWANVAITPTYNMLTCFHPITEERNIRFDNALDDLFSTIPSKIRGGGRLHPYTLFFQNKLLSFIPNANTFLPPITPNNIGNFAKKVRPVIGQYLRKNIKKNTNEPVLNTSGSWVLLDEMYRKDNKYKARIEKVLNDKISFPEEIFNHLEIRRIWKEFQAGNYNNYYEIRSLLSFGVLHGLIPTSDILST